MTATHEKTHIWDTVATRVGWYDPENYYSALSKQGVPVEQIIEQAERNGDYLGTIIVEGNVALNEGLAVVGDLIIGAGSPTNYASAYIGVGDSDTAAAASQTALQAATNKAYAAMDSTYPKRSSQTLSFKATFAAGTGSFAWKEVTVINAATDAGANLNRKTGDWGTKGASDSYSMQVDITLS
mgnify:CR=1 FL=1